MKGLREPYLVIGAHGMLGTDLVTLLAESGVNTVGLDVDQIDIRAPGSIEEALTRYKPGVIINVAALTDVDGCEGRVEEAFMVNAQGPENLARAAIGSGAFLVHVSTDYVFDGRKRSPYKEDEAMNPTGVYGRSKGHGETRVRELRPERHCIVRTQWLFGLHGKNFVEAILGAAETREVLKVVNDQRGCPSYTLDIAAALVGLCQKGVRGTVHVTNSGEATWFDFAVAIISRAGLKDVRVEPITTAELGRPAPRPAYSVLDNSRFVSIMGAPLRRWETALDHYLLRRVQRRSTPK